MAFAGNASPDSRADRELSARLRRIEGQVRGLQRMIEEQRSCDDIVTQLSAARSAFDQACAVFMERSLDKCLHENLETGHSREEALEALVKSFSRLI